MSANAPQAVPPAYSPKSTADAGNNAPPSHIQAQYFKGMEMFDSEITRFWTRFNIFMSIQLLIVAGFAANLERLLSHKLLAFLLFAAAICFSVFTIAVVYRSLQIAEAIRKTLTTIEEEHPQLMILSMFNQQLKRPMGSIIRYCIVMSCIMAVFWILFYAFFMRA